jgi:hypothetical protein
MVPVLALTALLPARVLRAQDAPDFATIRKSDFSSTIDRDRVSAWVAARFDELLAADNALTAGARFYQTMLEHVRATDATRGFKEGMARIVADEFAKRYQARRQKNPPDNPIPYVVALTVLRAYDQPSALPVFQSALTDPQAGVRLAAASGLLAMRIPDAQWNQLLPVVQQAAATETDPVTLSRLGQILTRDAGPPLAQAADAVLAVMDARLTRFERQGELPNHADADWAAWLGRRLARTDDTQLRTRIVRTLARLLADAAHAYVNQELPSEIRRDIEVVIASAERQLKLLTNLPANQPIDVTAALFADEATRDEAITREVDKWIGTDQTTGYLNQAPWNFPPGLGIDRTPPATQPTTGTTG